MAFLEDFESVIGFVNAIDTGKMDRLYDSLALRMEANASKELADALDTMGPENFQKYVAPSRAALRARRDQLRLEHEERMFNEKLQQEKLRTLALAKELKLDTTDD